MESWVSVCGVGADGSHGHGEGTHEMMSRVGGASTEGLGTLGS